MALFLGISWCRSLSSVQSRRTCPAGLRAGRVLWLCDHLSAVAASGAILCHRLRSVLGLSSSSRSTPGPHLHVRSVRGSRWSLHVRTWLLVGGAGSGSCNSGGQPLPSRISSSLYREGASFPIHSLRASAEWARVARRSRAAVTSSMASLLFLRVGLGLSVATRPC
jgi:hypothetical protein